MAPETLENENRFDDRVAGGVSLACFYTPWSAPCRLQMTILERLVRRYRTRVTMLDINVDYLEHLRKRFGVHNIPTVIVFNNGTECRRLVGVHPESDLCEVIDAELAAQPLSDPDKVKLNE